MNCREMWSNGSELYEKCLSDLKRFGHRNTIGPTNAPSNVPSNYEQSQQQQVYATQVACPTSVHLSAHPIAHTNSFVDAGSVIDESAAIPSTKGPLDAYKLLSNRHRDDVRNKYKYVQSSNVTKILGEWWSECSADCKRQHRELAKDMKAEHERNRSSSANEIKAPERAGGSIKHQQSPDLRDRVKRFVPNSIGENMDGIVGQPSTVFSAQIGNGHGIRKPESVFTEAPTPATMPSVPDVKSSLSKRYDSLPKFDFENFESGTDWNVYDDNQQKAKMKQRTIELNTFGSSENKVNETPASGSKMVEFQSSEKVIRDLVLAYGMDPPQQHIIAALNENGDLFDNDIGILKSKIRELQKKVQSSNAPQQN